MGEPHFKHKYTYYTGIHCLEIRALRPIVRAEFHTKCSDFVHYVSHRDSYDFIFKNSSESNPYLNREIFCYVYDGEFVALRLVRWRLENDSEAFADHLFEKTWCDLVCHLVTKVSHYVVPN